jgi:hypothetical protein
LQLISLPDRICLTSGPSAVSDHSPWYAIRSSCESLPATFLPDVKPDSTVRFPECRGPNRTGRRVGAVDTVMWNEALSED